jgi:hypothetical protein
MAVVGTATINFTSTPSEEATVIVSGQAGLISTTHIEAWIQDGDSTADNGTDEHAEFSAMCPLACKWTVDGSFEIKAMPIGATGIGTFTVHWAWSN